MWREASLAALLACMAIPAAAQTLAAPVIKRIPAEEANQGVASDGAYVYAIDNSRIGKYAIATGKRVAQWQGDKLRFPHVNSCTIMGRQLVCAASNYPAVPQTSAVEFFDRRSLRHLRTVSLGEGPGSLTVINRHDGKWWAVFANYDGKGGQPGRDHRHTLLVRLDDQFRQEAAWTFPPELLEKFAPKSCSGASWGRDGRLYVTGHDRKEIYALELPATGSVLTLAATIPIATAGQAIDWDPSKAWRLWSISRDDKMLVASAIAPVR
jgi:outer membrane protein assembly factor BamB